jgi:SAM-dependent methyltransferase
MKRETNRRIVDSRITFPKWLPSDSDILDHYRGTVLYWPYKVRLTKWLAALLPLEGSCTILDVGSGDGRLGTFLQKYRPYTKVFGVETMLRQEANSLAGLALFDGTRLPFLDASFDVSLLCDVLHHTENPEQLLNEVGRVTRKLIIIKDHLYKNFFEKKLLYTLDVLGNFRFGVRVAGNYLNKSKWEALLSFVEVSSRELHSAVKLRSGVLEKLFPNELEIIFVLKLPSVPPGCSRNEANL